MKEVIYTQLRDHLKQLFKGSLKMLKMLKKEIPDQHLIKLRGHIKQFRGNLIKGLSKKLNLRVISVN